MTYSPDYIKRSDCEEIQEQWEPDIGNEIVHKSDGAPYHITPYHMVAFAKAKGHLATVRAKVVFLPAERWYIDRLIKDEALNGKYEDEEMLLVFLTAWMNNKQARDEGPLGMSILDLLQHFYMAELFNKAWTGEKWSEK